MTIILIVKFMSEIITSCRRDYQPEVSKDSQRNRRIPVLIYNDGMLVNVPKGTLLKFFFCLSFVNTRTFAVAMLEFLFRQSSLLSLCCSSATFIKSESGD